MSEFDGFQWPEANYFRMPNEWVNITSEIDNLAELKVLTYILRHTWGFGEFDGELKRLSLSDFTHGRRRRDGDRMDKGIGLDKKSVIRGLKKAEEHGYIEVVVNKRDLGRIAKFYRLKMSGSSIRTARGDVPPAIRTSRGDVPPGGETLHRTKKDTTLSKERDVKERHERQPQAAGSPENSCGFFNEDNDGVEMEIQDAELTNAAKELAEELYRRGRFMKRKKPDIRKWVCQATEFIKEEGRPRGEVIETIRYFTENLNHEYMPYADSMNTLLDKYARVRYQMDRNGGNGKLKDRYDDFLRRRHAAVQ